MNIRGLNRTLESVRFLHGRCTNDGLDSVSRVRLVGGLCSCSLLTLNSLFRVSPFGMKEVLGEDCGFGCTSGRRKAARYRDSVANVPP